MLVCNDNNEVVGVVTRKDLARFRVVHHGSRMARYFSIWRLKHINHDSPGRWCKSRNKSISEPTVII